MAWLWFVLVVVASALVLLLIRLVFGPGRLRRRLAFPVAVAERTLADALADLTSRTDEELCLMPAPLPPRAPSEHQVLVNAFEPLVDKLARFSMADIASLGKEAVREYETLVEAVRIWNGAAGHIAGVETLIPTVMAGYHAAHSLTARLGEEGHSARDQAQSRVLFGLVGEPDPRGLPQ